MVPDLLTGDLPVVVLITHNAPRAARLTPSSLLPNVASCRTIKCKNTQQIEKQIN